MVDETAELPEAEDEGNWIEIRRASSQIEADMVRDFLKEHGVPSAFNGDSGVTRQPWQPALQDIRIVVAPRNVESAREVLEAMVADTKEHPFRGAPPALKDDDEPKFEKPRSAIAAALFAVLIPVGGAGHFYARHGAAGTIFCCGILGGYVGVIVGGHPELALAIGILGIADVVGSVFAVRRFNAKRVPSEGVQRKWAIAVLVVAYAVAFFAGRR